LLVSRGCVVVIVVDETRKRVKKKTKKPTVVAQQHRRRLDAVLLGDPHHRLGREEGTPRAAERRVGHDVDAVGTAEVHDLLLWKGGMVLDLVDGWDYGAMREELV